MAAKSTKKGSKVWVCATAQNSDLNQAGYEALTWVQVGKVGNPGDLGATSNLPTYDTLDETVTQKQKGVANAGDPLNQNNLAIMWERNDMPSGGVANTRIYSRGVVSGPMYPGGGSDDFDLERFTIGLNQIPIRVNAA